VLEVDTPEPVLVQVADGDAFVTHVFLETKVAGKAVAGHMVARDVANNDAQSVSQQKPDEGMNEVRVGGQCSLGLSFLQNVGFDEDCVARGKSAQKELLAGCKHLGQSFFVVVVEPVDPCLHAFLL
jgi:hypothetical protein